MAEASNPESRGIQPPPTFIGAIFETGRSRSMVHEWVITDEHPSGRDIVPVEHIEDAKGRENWVFENMRVFNDGTVAQPEASWKGIIDYHLSELLVAEKSAIREGKTLKREEIEKTAEFLKAAMAISSSARAMEVSSGVPGAYECYITQSFPEPNPDRQDSWAEFLLHKDPKKIKTLLDNPMVNKFYKMIIDDAGMGKVLERDKNGNFKFDKKERFIVDWDKFDPQKAIDGQLIGFLINKIPSPLGKEEDKKWKEDWENKHLVLDEEKKELNEDGELKEVGKKWESKSSLNDYIWEVLLSDENIKKLGKEDKDIPALWSAARLAADTFVVDKFTKWDYELCKVFPEKEQPRMKPSKGWGGDPLKTILAPSFLPTVVKRVYAHDEVGKTIALWINKAFRPDDLEFTGKVKNPKTGEMEEKITKVENIIDDELPCSMTCSLKSFDRYNDALWMFLGQKSRAPGLDKWDKDAMEKYLPAIVEKLDDVHGKFESGIENDETFPKELMGKIIARMILCKTLAAVYTSDRPSITDSIGFVVDKDADERLKPLLGVKHFLWGPKNDGKEGFLRNLAGARTGFKFTDSYNRFKPIKDLQMTFNLLTSNDQGDLNGRKLQFQSTIAILVNSLAALAPSKKR
jgi:hypothetical protein